MARRAEQGGGQRSRVRPGRTWRRVAGLGGRGAEGSPDRWALECPVRGPGETIRYGDAGLAADSPVEPSHGVGRSPGAPEGSGSPGTPGRSGVWGDVRRRCRASRTSLDSAAGRERRRSWRSGQWPGREPPGCRSGTCLVGPCG